MKLTVVIACFNEKKTVKKLLDRVQKINIKKQIIIIDDGSTDGTVKILKKIQKKNIDIIFKKKNEGKGSAIQKSIPLIKGEIVLIQDADLEYHPKDYYKLLKPFKKKRNKSCLWI